MSEHVMENKLGHEWAHVSPHDSTKSLDVYLVPEGAQPEAVWFPSRTWLTPRVTTWSLHGSTGPHWGSRKKVRTA